METHGGEGSQSSKKKFKGRIVEEKRKRRDMRMDTGDASTREVRGEPGAKEGFRGVASVSGMGGGGLGGPLPEGEFVD